MPDQLAERIRLHTELSSSLSVMSSAQLLNLTKTVPYAENGWGSHGVVRLGKRKIFVKRVPVTDLEAEHPYSTKNLHRLPLYYNYGLGSAGLGVFREIIANIKTTNWVICGDYPFFPLMYHHRIVPWPGRKPPMNSDKQARSIRYWNNSRAVGAFREARAYAKHQALLFIEYIPHVLSTWIHKDLSRLPQVIPRILETLDFLRAKGLIHCDAHHWNIVTAGRDPYLTDLGLVSDLDFHLSKPEREFHNRNTYYGAGEFLSCAVGYVFGTFRNLPLRKRKPIARLCGLVGGETTLERIRAVRDNVERIQSAGLMRFPDSFIDIATLYRNVDEIHRTWENRMQIGIRKHYRYDNERVRRLINRTVKK